MPSARWQVADRDLLRKLMQRAPGGPLDTRTLANRVGVSKSKISALLTGDRPTITADKGEQIAQQLGVHPGCAFNRPAEPP